MACPLAVISVRSSAAVVSKGVRDKRKERKGEKSRFGKWMWPDTSRNTSLKCFSLGSDKR